MVNRIVLEYLRTNRGNYKLEDLKKKVLASGYSKKDLSEALNQLNRQSQNNIPTIPATINKINNTNIDMNANKTKYQNTVPQNATQQGLVIQKTPTKKKQIEWFKWIIIICVILIILTTIFFSAWFWNVKFVG